MALTAYVAVSQEWTNTKTCCPLLLGNPWGLCGFFAINAFFHNKCNIYPI